MEFISQELDQYCCSHTAEENELLKRINRETHVEVLQPRMLSGHFQGRVLSMLSKMMQPHRILEIGTYTGYSALCLAEGLASDGKLVTIDVNEELTPILKRWSLNKQIQYIISPALDVIPTLNETWDLVFIDADKQNYIEYYELILPLVRPGGYVILDNVLWSGKVAEPDKNDKDTVLLRKLNALIHTDERVEEVLLPIRDGLMIARKK